MKKLISILFTLLITTASAGDLDKIYSSASEQISHKLSQLVPGDGITEVSLEIKGDGSDEVDFSFLGVRDIYLQENSNLFTQFSFLNTEVNNDDRFYGNLGFGYRTLSPGGNFIFGVNTFFDQDINEGHQRVGAGLEAKGSILDLSVNRYQKATIMKVVNGSEEQVLSGWDYNITSQLPRMPWAKFNWNGYMHEAEQAKEDSKGYIYGLELAVTPSLELILSEDNATNSGVEDVYLARLNFVYPPKNLENTMQDGLSDDIWQKENMKDKLREKVRRENRMTVEIQGAVIITKK